MGMYRVASALKSTHSLIEDLGLLPSTHMVAYYPMFLPCATTVTQALMPSPGFSEHHFHICRTYNAFMQTLLHVNL